MGHNPAEENGGLTSVQWHRSARGYTRFSYRRQWLVCVLRIDRQLACGAVRHAMGKRRDDGDIALKNVAMECKEVPLLLVVGITPASSRGDGGAANSAKRFGHLLT